jgi:5'-nucleotidase
MKTIKYLLPAVVAASLALAPDAAADKLVILHTNDTHSQIDPTDSDNLGGVLRRKVVIDSVRAAEKNCLLVDAGDVVQGSLYFNLKGGEVEQRLMNEMGYDLRILGNHEFDNGVDSLAFMLKDSKAENLSTNYDFTDTKLAQIFKPYSIRTFGDKRIGFIAINLDPKGIIDDDNSQGVVFKDAVKAANSAAWWLKNIEKVDGVVALTHIGYTPSVEPGDSALAASSENIDLIIGGHSHTLLDPSSPKASQPTLVKNLAGKDVLIAQVGKSGKYIGKVELDMDNMTAREELIRIDSRLDSRIDRNLAAVIELYRQGVDSLNSVKVARSAILLEQKGMPILNFVADFIYDRGCQLADGVDFALINKGGIRRDLPKGDITEGQIITTLPFNNRIVVMDIKGKDLRAAFDVMATVDGNGVSRQIEATFVPGTDAHAVEILLNGKSLEDNKTYRVATIDYMANGGDYMVTLKNHTEIARSKSVVYKDLLTYLRSGKMKGKKINPSATRRMHPVDASSK